LLPLAWSAGDTHRLLQRANAGSAASSADALVLLLLLCLKTADNTDLNWTVDPAVSTFH